MVACRLMRMCLCGTIRPAFAHRVWQKSLQRANKFQALCNTQKKTLLPARCLGSAQHTHTVLSSSFFGFDSDQIFVVRNCYLGRKKRNVSFGAFSKIRRRSP